MSRSTTYAHELASGSFANARIERLFVRSKRAQLVRFADWRGGRFNACALEIREDDLVVLIGEAIAAGVFSRAFLIDLTAVLTAVVDPI